MRRSLSLSRRSVFLGSIPAIALRSTSCCCVCACVQEGQRERGRESERVRQRERGSRSEGHTQENRGNTRVTLSPSPPPSPSPFSPSLSPPHTRNLGLLLVECLNRRSHQAARPASVVTVNLECVLRSECVNYR